jgi:hypothetical protein
MEYTQEVALTVQPQSQTLKKGLAALAEVLSHNLAPADLVSVFNQLKVFSKNLEDLEKIAKARMLAYVQEHGARISEAGSMKATVGDYSIEATVRNSGYDPAKVQMLLRSKDLDPVAGCDTFISYKPNNDKLAGLVASGRLTADELEGTRYEKQYNLKQPVKVAKDE